MKEKLRTALLLLFIFLLPTQLGKHFFLSFSFVHGVRIDYLAPTLYVVDLVVLVLTFCISSRYKKHVVRNKIILLMFAVLCSINIVLAPVPLMGIYTVARFVEVYIVYVIVAHERGRLALPIIAMLTAGALLQAILATLQFVQKGSLQGFFYYFGERFFTISTPGISTTSLNGTELLRPYGTFSHPNSLGGFFVVLYALSLGFLLHKKGSRIRIACSMLAAISAFLVFFSFSKAAIGALLCTTIVHGLLQFINHRAKHKKICWQCVVSRILIPFVLALVFLQAKGDVYSTTKRITLIEQAMILFGQYPFFGTGFGNNLYYQATFPSKFAEFFFATNSQYFFCFLWCKRGFFITSVAGWVAVQESSKKRLLIIVAVGVTGLFDHYWLTLVQNMLVLGVVLGLQEK
ncbi:MAG: hypothetical protein UZ22_OP11002001004 [Microgenomates bacterium OLB23]|nr:MAG: hypothetical protein UZ22_OP11002001004 [Microgenomates bacterium OLB23]